jgi:hypothetical protein
MQKKLKQEEIAVVSIIPNPNSRMLKEAANMIGLGIISQESGDHQMAQPLMKNGIEKIKEILLKEKTQNSKLIFEYVSIIFSYST